nr:hypothetical protein [uncultured Allomuricauda sp.]
MGRKLLIFLLTLVFLTCSKDSAPDEGLPIVTTDEPRSILRNSAILGGDVSESSEGTILEHGVEWGLAGIPPEEDNRIEIGSGPGTFRETYQIFEANTAYYYRAYAVNENGIGYGKVYEFTTADDMPCDYQMENHLYLNSMELVIDEFHISGSPGLGFANVSFFVGTVDDSTGHWYTVSLGFCELKAAFPLTGTYGIREDRTFFVDDCFDGKTHIRVNSNILDETLIVLNGESIYVENYDNKKMVFTFCDVQLSGNNTLNGQITYVDE